MECSVYMEVPVPDVGYRSLYSTVTNTALDALSSARRSIIALCGKCTGWLGGACDVETSKLVRIDAETGEP